MDFFDSRYFRINKKMLRFTGLWPYQSFLEKVFIRPPFVLLLITFSVPQILNIIKFMGVDISRVLQSVAVLFYLIMISSKMVMGIVTEGKFQRLYECIAQNWKMIKEKEDVEVLRKSSEFGRFLAVGYMSYMFSALIIFITFPVLPVLLDKIAPLNESRPLIFILEGEYFMDPFKNYNKIYAFESFVCVVTVLVFSTIDSTYAVCVQQCVALIDIVKQRMDIKMNLINSSETAEMREREAAHNSIIQAIVFHQKALDFASALESTYTITYLIVICFNSVILSVGAVIILMNLNRPMEFLRFSLIYGGLLIHLYYIAWTGQQIIDASHDLLTRTHSSKWYNYSFKTQKILQFMMMRCKIPCQLTAGGICVLNVENFGAILKTSLSYITVFASMV